MPKPMYVWSGSAWVSVASEVESLATYATQSYADNQPGSKLIVPSSVAVGSGTGSVGTSGAVTFSGASSVSLNSCFSSSYDNYKILVVLDSQSASDSFRVRMRASGTDATGSDYGTVQYYGTTGSGTMTVQQDASIAFSYVGDYNSTGSTSCDFTIFKPFSVVRTKYNWHTTMDYNGATRIFTGSGIHKQSTSYDGITFYAASGNVTGTIRVYGMKN
jgi:mevalonate kinase